jgi:DNA-binding transcriptional MerR regulator
MDSPKTASAGPSIPDKPYFKIGEVAKIAGVKPSVLRFWESEIGALRPEKSSTNQRVYTRRHVERVLEIKSLLYDQGFTIAGARRKLRTPAGKQRADEALLGRVEREVRELLRLIGD